MENLQAVIALVTSIPVMFLAPALVWVTVIAGLRRIVRDQVKERRGALVAHMA